MKRILLVFFIVVFDLNIKAQTNVYQPFPADSAVWMYITSTPTTSTASWTRWIGDTVINLKTYTKVFTSNYNGTIYGYSGGVRQDIPNEKIYMINLSGIEQDISVSQHLIVGDTMPLSSPTMSITSIDSTLIGTIYHKTYHANDTITRMSESYIVGVGLYSYSHGDANTMTNLTCFSVDTVNNPFSTTPLFCTLSYAIKQNKNNASIISVSPNPSSGNINILGNITIDELKVTDMLGQIVYEAKPKTKNTTLTLNDAGVYFITLTSGTEISTKKVIVNK